jgi:Spy/CpxP family protein refolding chaperone
MRTTKLRLLGGAVLGLVLVAGGVTGAAIDRAVASRRQAGAVHQRDECDRYRPERRRGPYDDLSLSPEQQQRIDAVLERRRVQLDSMMQQYRPRMDSVVSGTRAEIQEILTPEQRTEMDRRRAQREALYKRCQERLQQNGNGDRRPTQRRDERSQQGAPRLEEYRA